MGSFTKSVPRNALVVTLLRYRGNSSINPDNVRVAMIRRAIAIANGSLQAYGYGSHGNEPAGEQIILACSADAGMTPSDCFNVLATLVREIL